MCLYKYSLVKSLRRNYRLNIHNLIHSSILIKTVLIIEIYLKEMTNIL